MPPERNFTDADLRALKKLLAEQHQCQFSEDDRHDMRTLLQIYRDTTSEVRKWFIRLAVFGLLLLAGLGFYTKTKGG